MGKVILYIAMSLDGFIASSDGDISWLEKYQGSDEDYGYNDFYKKIGAVIMGANTYEKALALEGGIDAGMPTYVVAHRNIEIPPGTKVTGYSGNLTQLVSEIRTGTSKDVWLVGGGKLVQSFLEENLIDDLILSVIPIIIGEGIPLFGKTGRQIGLELRASRSFISGIVQLDYRAGESESVKK